MADTAIQQALQGNDTNLRRLPPDAIRSVALFLDADSILSLCQTSKYFNATVCGNNNFWWQLIERDLTADPDRLASLRQRVQENKANPVEGRYKLDIEMVTSPQQLYNIMYSDEVGPLTKLMSAAREGFEIYIDKTLPAMNDINTEYLMRTHPDEYDDEEDRGYDDELLRDAINEEIANIETEVAPVAAEEGYLDIVQILADKGYSLGSSLPHAALSGNLDLMKVAVKNRGDADLNYPEDYMNEALNEAIRKGYRDIVDYLLDEEDLDINNETSNGETAIMAALLGGDLDMVKYVVARGAVLPDEQSGSLVYNAVRSGNPDVLKFLVQRGIPITQAAHEEAVNFKQNEILRYLIEKHPLPDYNDVILALFTEDNTPMIDYIFEKHPQTDPQLLLDYMTRYGRIPIEVARKAFKYLLDKGADPSKLNPKDIRKDVLPLYREAIAKMKPKLVPLPVKGATLIKPPQRTVSKPSPMTSSPVRNETGLKPGYCQARTQGGKGPQCSRKVPEGVEFCWQHRP